MCRIYTLQRVTAGSKSQAREQKGKGSTILVLKFNQQCKNKEEGITMHQNCPNFDGVTFSFYETCKTVHMSKFYIVMAEFK